MHLAYPKRRNSHSAPYASRSTTTRVINALWRIPRSRAVLAISSICFTLWALSRLFGSSSSSGTASSPRPFVQAPSGHPNVVLVTTMNPKLDPFFNDAVKQNREGYAAIHGYATFFPNTTDYPLHDDPESWSKVPAMRHAMTLFPKTPYFFFLDDHTVITNPSLRLEDHILKAERLESLMIKDIPVVPPDSVIKTSSNLKGDKVDFILTQDKEGLSHNSFILRQGEWAKFLLDAWFDPLYRSYTFQKAERHALEHIVQWHGTILAKLALVPQSIMNSYSQKDANMASGNGLFKEGDFILNFGDCDKPDRSCELEMRPWFQQSQEGKQS